MTEPTREQLLHLANRARNGVALDAEHDALAAGITATALRMTELARELDKQRWHVADAERRVRCQRERAEQAEAAIERVRAWIAGEPVTARSEFGSGYREALRDITAALDQAQQPTA